MPFLLLCCMSMQAWGSASHMVWWNMSDPPTVCLSVQHCKPVPVGAAGPVGSPVAKSSGIFQRISLPYVMPSLLSPLAVSVYCSSSAVRAAGPACGLTPTKPRQELTSLSSPPSAPVCVLQWEPLPAGFASPASLAPAQGLPPLTVAA